MMIRQISPGPTLAPDAVSAAEPVNAPATGPATAAAPADTRDALAGALPAWDLLPATPFIRRVK
ncbi:hypothetical protein [Achromobacter mucicolens]|uniref:hypothetical protein n=1 Tax=Achromobacter mucicolens TaxID=1389922 RepID=UPI0022F3DB58|nr:hypothetical protein [Achromobacter mucicolens]WBX88289.1 hypothetical protein PE062_23195 [Achromobacter mucicolens]